MLDCRADDSCGSDESKTIVFALSAVLLQSTPASVFKRASILFLFKIQTYLFLTTERSPSKGGNFKNNDGTINMLFEETSRIRINLSHIYLNVLDTERI